MQTTDDGEYIPAKELDLNFKIPKKETRAPNPQPPVVAAPVMENSYYNYYPDYYNILSAPPPPGTLEVAPVAQILALAPPPPPPPIAEPPTNNNRRERAKNYGNHILQETIPDLFDGTLPRELTQLFQPLFCKLCDAQLSSNIVARMHYKSKNHEKKVRKFLLDHAQQTGEPVHKRARLNAGPKTRTDLDNPMYFYCEVCDLPLTGKMHAESHYAGRNHRKATLGVKKPAGKGHFDPVTGKWVRDSGNVANNTDDGFGCDFRRVASVPMQVVESKGSGYRCFICNVTTTCQEQLENHLAGKKHLKKAKMVGGGGGYQFQASPPPPPQPPVAPVVVVEQVEEIDISNNRTPSGQFYCPVCNLTLNSEFQFKQHCQSKSHLKKKSAK